MKLPRLLCAAAFALAATAVTAQEPAWNAAAKECDRACLVAIVDGYANAIVKHDLGDRTTVDRQHRAAGDRAAHYAADHPHRGRARNMRSREMRCDGGPPGMLQNLATMETFSVRGGLIHHVEAAPFVSIPYGLGNGWTPGSGR